MMKKVGLSFQRFPNPVKHKGKWEKWVQAVRGINADGSPWFPTGKYTYLCSDNFLFREKNNLITLLTLFLHLRCFFGSIIVFLVLHSSALY